MRGKRRKDTRTESFGPKFITNQVTIPRCLYKEAYILLKDNKIYKNV